MFAFVSGEETMAQLKEDAESPSKVAMAVMNETTK